MVINGEPTVELDYSGLHIRMLYHRIGLDYRDECYVYDKADKANRIDRERMKLASLIVINSDDRLSTTSAGKRISTIQPVNLAATVPWWTGSKSNMSQSRSSSLKVWDWNFNIWIAPSWRPYWNE